MGRTAVLNIVGLTARHIGEHTPNLLSWIKHKQIAPVRPMLPAVTTTVQSTYVTGKRVSDHGIVANGWYNRELAEVHMWKQSNHLVRGEKLWDVLRAEHPGFTTAKLFWWYNMYSTADYTITPRPIYRADGGKVFDIYTHPSDIRERVKKDLGDFPFPAFWGPMSGIDSTKWIADSAKWVEEKHWPNLSLVYLPHLDYNLQRLGPDDPAIAADLLALDKIVGNLIDFYRNRAIRLIILSEYGIVPVSKPVHLNRVFRRKGWITVREELGGEILDCGASRAFAIADHQVAHIYVNDPTILEEVKQVCLETEGVENVIDSVWKASIGIDHQRAGEFVAVSKADSWFTYYYWVDDARAPDFARCVDIHRKPGYDPVELFIDPTLKHPKLALLKRLAKKKMGFRMLMDVIPLDATLVKGSHGRPPDSILDWPILAGDFPHLETQSEIASTQVFHEILRACREGIAEDSAAAG